MQTAIIIGAGPAGLTAAYQLLKETNIKPIILEATDIIGGISATITHNGNRLDLGGHRFFSKNKQVMQLWTELMPVQGAPAIDDKILGSKKDYAVAGPDPELSDGVMLIRHRLSRILYLRSFFSYPISLSFTTFKNMGLWRTFVAGIGYIYAMLFKREEKSLEDFFVNRFGYPLYSMFFEDYTEKLWGVHPRNIAPDWGAQRVKGLSLFKAVSEFIKKTLNIKSKQIETSLIDEFFYPKKGPGQLYELMAEKIKTVGGKIHLNSEVRNIEIHGDEIVSVTTLDGRKFAGEYFISSMPIRDLINALDDKARNNNINEVANGLVYREFMTVGLLVKNLKLKNETKLKTVNNIIPDSWIYVQERDVRLGRIQVFNNWSPYMVADFENTVFIGLEYFCNEGDEMWKQSDEDFIKFAVAELVKLKIIDENDVLDSVRIKVKKAYPAYFGTYEKFNIVREYLNVFDNLYCIGRNGQHRYNNMDHSMLCAIETVKVIKNGGLNKYKIWDVNAEQEYHEEVNT